MAGKILLFLLIASLGVYGNWVRLRATIKGYRRGPAHEKLRFQFSLREILIATTLLAIVLGLAVWARR